MGLYASNFTSWIKPIWITKQTSATKVFVQLLLSLLQNGVRQPRLQSYQLACN